MFTKNKLIAIPIIVLLNNPKSSLFVTALIKGFPARMHSPPNVSITAKIKPVADPGNPNSIAEIII